MGGYSGADCAALLREAGLAVLRDDNKKKVHSSSSSSSKEELQITMKHLYYALDHIIPSVSKIDQRNYERMQFRITNNQGKRNKKGKIGSNNNTANKDSIIEVDKNLNQDKERII